MKTITIITVDGVRTEITRPYTVEEQAIIDAERAYDAGLEALRNNKALQREAALNPTGPPQTTLAGLQKQIDNLRAYLYEVL